MREQVFDTSKTGNGHSLEPVQKIHIVEHHGEICAKPRLSIPPLGQIAGGTVLEFEVRNDWVFGAIGHFPEGDAGR